MKKLMDMVVWKCGKCGKLYNNKSLIELKKIKLVPNDPNPMKNYGYTSVCPCGYRFHRDKWHRITNIKISGMFKQKPIWIHIKISTVFLELNHFGFWFESMIFPIIKGKKRKEVTCFYSMRYKSKRDAVKGHYKILKIFQKGRYSLHEDGKELELIIGS